jgi:hypothetical protein
MKISALVLAAVAQVASAHYFFDAVYVNGAAQTKYVRPSTRAVKYNPIKFSSNPAADIRDNSYIDKNDDARCNQGASRTGGNIDVLSVTAGSQIKVRVGAGAKMGHPGT